MELTSGVAEYLFRSRDRIEKAINAGLNDKVFRADDLEFTVAARQWGECVSFGNFDLYERRFMDTASKYRLVCPEFSLLSLLVSCSAYLSVSTTSRFIELSVNFSGARQLSHCSCHPFHECPRHSGSGSGLRSRRWCAALGDRRRVPLRSGHARHGRPARHARLNHASRV